MDETIPGEKIVDKWKNVLLGIFIESNIVIFYWEFLGKEKNCTDMHLTVNPNNRNAIKVYENFGMEVNNISYMMKL